MNAFSRYLKGDDGALPVAVIWGIMILAGMLLAIPLTWMLSQMFAMMLANVVAIAVLLLVSPIALPPLVRMLRKGFEKLLEKGSAPQEEKPKSGDVKGE